MVEGAVVKKMRQEFPVTGCCDGPRDNLLGTGILLREFSGEELEICGFISKPPEGSDLPR